MSGRTITDIREIDSLVKGIQIRLLNTPEFPGITANNSRDITVGLSVTEQGEPDPGTGTAVYALQAENDPVQYIRPVGSPVNITGMLADGDLAITLNVDEGTGPHADSSGFFTDGGDGPGNLSFSDPTVSGDTSIISLNTSNQDSSIDADELRFMLRLIA